MIASSAKARINGSRSSCPATSSLDLARVRVFTGTRSANVWDIATILSAGMATSCLGSADGSPERTQWPCRPSVWQ